jgi:hypothetical protein
MAEGAKLKPRYTGADALQLSKYRLAAIAETFHTTPGSFAEIASAQLGTVRRESEECVTGFITTMVPSGPSGGLGE